MELTITPWWSALLHNDLGRHEEALAATEQATEDPEELLLSTWALPEHVEGGCPYRTRRQRGRRAAAALSETRAKRLGLGARDRAALARAADRGRCRRLALSQGDRKARPNAPSRAARPRASPLPRMVASQRSAHRGARSAAHGAREADRDGRGGVRTARGRGSSRVARSSPAAAPRATPCRSSRCSTSARAVRSSASCDREAVSRSQPLAQVTGEPPCADTGRRRAGCRRARSGRRRSAHRNLRPSSCRCRGGRCQTSA
jgi:hypothetical protein